MGCRAERHAGAQRGKELIDKLMIYSRHEKAIEKSIDVKKFIQDRVDYYAVGLSHSIKLLTSIDPNTPKISIDPVQLDQVVLNLLVNARDAIKDSGFIKLSIKGVTAYEKESNITHEKFSGDYVCLTVEDNGVGIDSELIEHIFEPFFTTKALGQGTGLGLSIVYGIVSENGGKIIVISEEGKGTQTQIYFPASDDEGD